MAKKTPTRKAATKRTPTKQAARASGGRRRKPTTKPARPVRRSATPRAAGLEPYPVATGRGPSAAEIGRSLVALFNQGKSAEVEKRWWSPEIESVEGMGLAWRGKRAVDGKNTQWMSEHILHGGSAEGPFVGASGFSVRFRVDAENRASGRREVMDEIGVYTVRDGKIVREEFMYADSPPRADGTLPG